MVEYDDLTHTYWVDGQICPSVTQIIAWKFPDKYSMVSEEVLREASLKGTELHNAIEVYEKYGMERDDLLEFRNYKFLKNKFNFKVIGNEEIVTLTYKGLTVCGRTDLIVQNSDGRIGLADIKRTASIDKTYLAYQLNMYKVGYQQTFRKPIDFLECIWLKDDKRKIVDIPIASGIVAELLDEYSEYWEEYKKSIKPQEEREKEIVDVK